MIELQYYLSNVPDCLIYGLLAMGIYISLRILDIPDLTTEGSFGFGAVISVLVALAGHPILALFAGMIAGGFAGVITGFLQTKLKVHPVLAGIITMSGLYSINLVCYSLTEKGATTNLSYNKITVFEKIKQLLLIRGQFETSIVKTVVSLIIVIIVLLIVIWFFKTHIGLCIRATGDNPDMVRASSINVDRTKIIGLMLANGLIGLSGALSSQSLGYSDVNTANGTLIYGLAAVIIGEAIFSRIFRNFALKLLSVVFGSILYYLVLQVVIWMGIDTDLLKMLSALVVALFLAFPYWKGKYFTKAKQGGK